MKYGAHHFKDGNRGLGLNNGAEQEQPSDQPPPQVRILPM